MLMTDLNLDEIDGDENSEEPRFDSSTLKKEIFAMMENKQRLLFYSRYLEKYTKDVNDRIAYVDRKLIVLEANYAAVFQKETAEEKLLSTLGLTRLEGNEKIADLYAAVSGYGRYKNASWFVRRVRGKLLLFVVHVVMGCVP